MNYHYNLKTLFAEICTQYPKRIALHLDGIDYTYEQLNHTSDALAYHLKGLGVFKGSVIAIASMKVCEDYALMIACLKSGVAYVNLDILNPKERTMSILKTCAAKVVFIHTLSQEIQDACQASNVRLITYKSLSPCGKFDAPADDIDGETLAYIMYTSGSTGVPKGAAMTHQNIIHFIYWTTNRYNITPEDNFANISPMYFDNSVFDFYTALFSGASLTPISRELLGKPLEFIQYIEKHACTIWFSVPSMLIYMTATKVLSNQSLPSLRIITFGGEGYPKTELKKIYDLYKHRIKFINVYGPTECTCICSSYDIHDEDFEDLTELPSLGTINPNFSFLILNEDKKTSTEGELYLLGPNVGKGYFNDKERSREIFSLYTDGCHYQKNMYKTGDLVCERNGLLYFRGRKDNQIKHMGYRIELEEIETALNASPQVRQSAVIYLRTNSAYGKIIAFLTPDGKDIDQIQLKKELQAKLPIYMMPQIFKVIPEFPQNANGKIDKKKLSVMAI